MSSEWQLTTLGAICSTQGGAIQTGPFGSQLHTSDYKEIGVPVVMPTNIGDGGIAVEGIARIDQEDVERLQQHKLQLDDIVFSRRGDVTKNALVRAHEAGWLCGTGCLKVRLGDQTTANAKFISYCLRLPDTKEWLIRHAVGATMPNLNTGILSAVPIILPPLSLQLEIAEILAALDDRITLLRETNATLEAIAQALFKSWFVDFDPVHVKAEGRARQDGERSGQPRMPQASDLPRPGAEAGSEAQGQPEGAIQGSMSAAEGTTAGMPEVGQRREQLPRMPKAAMDATTAALFPDSFEESELGLVPKGWLLSALGDAFEINPTRKLKKGDFAPYLDMASVGTQGHVVDGVVGREMGSGTKFINGDTLLARITPCLENGKTAYVDFLDAGQVGWGSTEFVVLRPKAPLPPYYGYLLARHPAFRDHAIQSMSGTSGRQRIQNDVLGRYPVAIPPPEVAEAFAGIVQSAQQRIAANQEQAQTLTQLRDTLLPRLISGQLRLPEAEATVEEVL